MDALAAREAVLVGRTHRRSRAPVPSRAGNVPELRLRARCARAGRGGPRADARCPAAAPPRHERAVSRPPHRRSPLPRQRARAEPAVLGCLVARGEEGPRMKRLTLVAVAVAALAWPALAAAHPLGNFT